MIRFIAIQCMHHLQAFHQLLLTYNIVQESGFLNLVLILNSFISLVQNLLYFSTMHPSRIAKLITLATTRCLANKLPLNSSIRQWTTPHAGLNLNSQNRFFFSSQQVDPENEGEVEGKDFADYITDQNVLGRLKQHGILKMFPVQEETFRLIEAGKDVLASDRTGSGKTLGYTLPVLQNFNKKKYNLSAVKTPKFLIMCPTRELVLQVSSEISKFNSIYKVVPVYGGSSIERQITEISRGVAIIVATPGRLIDLLERKAINLQELQVVCIDEADTMLEKGFKDDIEQIFGYIRGAAGKTQNIMFSATIPTWVIKIAREYFDQDLQRINMIKEHDNRTSQTVDHLALCVKRGERHKTIKTLIEKYNPNNRTIIFTQTKAEANDFMTEFQSKQIVILHGDIPQYNRETNLRDFRNGHKKILIATDVAARGIDIPEVELIIQLSPPENPESYIHRSGRTGRAGKQGTNITFFDESNVSDLIEIEKAANIKITIISNNYNISFWQSKLKKLLHRVADYQPTSNSVVYQHFLQQLLTKTTPQKALLYLLNEHMGAQPEAVSVVNNKKGFVTYIAFPIEGKNARLSDAFDGIKINHETVDKEGIKFDISISDFYKFEELIDKQDDFEIESLDENSNMTLSLYAKKLGRSGSSSYQQNRDRRGGHGRDSGYSRDNNRDSREEWHDRRDRAPSHMRQERNQKHEKHDRYKNKRDHLPPEGLSNYRVFIFGFSPEVKERDMKDQIVNQTQLTGFKLKVVNKQDESGNIKTFGFIEFNNREDCVTFLESSVQVNGEAIRKKMSEQKIERS